MSVAIRLKRSGRKHLPFYHVGIFHSRTRRDGTPIEKVGFFDPVSNAQEKLRLDIDRIKYWLEQGAKPSDTVITLLKQSGLTSELWATTPNKKRKVKEGAGQKKATAKKARTVKVRKKGRTTNSKIRREKKPAK